MKKAFYLVIGLLLIWLGLAGDERKVLDRSFSGIQQIEFNLVSSDCQIRAVSGDAVKVHLEYTYPADRYSPEMEAQGDRLVIRDKFSHSLFGSGHGESYWKLEVPKSCRIEFHSASGDLSVEGISGAVSARAASGDIKLENIGGECRIDTASGDIELNNISAPLSIRAASGDIHARRIRADKMQLKVASGDIEISDSQGEFDVKTASGDIEAKDVEITKASRFHAASGDVEVGLAKSPAVDLDLGAASGNVRLDYNGQPLQGYFECMVKKDSGDIESSVAFEKTEEVMEHGQVYVKKSFTRKSATPKITLKSASGTVELIER